MAPVTSPPWPRPGTRQSTGGIRLERAAAARSPGPRVLSAAIDEVQHSPTSLPQSGEGVDACADSVGEQKQVDVELPGTRLLCLLSRPCGTCVTFPDDRMHLGEDRRLEFIQEAVASDSYIVCHSTLKPGQRRAICRGYWNLYRERVWPLRVAEGRDMIVEVDLPGSDGELPAGPAEEPSAAFTR